VPLVFNVGETAGGHGGHKRKALQALESDGKAKIDGPASAETDMR
jgi:hypothetical protein